MANALGEAVTRLLPTLLMVLSRNSDRAIDLKARVELQEAHHELSLRKDVIAKDVIKRFNELVFKRLEIESNSPREDLAGGLLALLPEADLDEQIYADDLAQRMRAAGGEEYAALINRAHLLTGFSHQEDRCPLSAGIFAAALIQALRSITKDRLVWAALRPELIIDFPNDIAIAMADVNDYLRQNKILPDMPRFIAKVETARKPVESVANSHSSVATKADAALQARGLQTQGAQTQPTPGDLIVRANGAVGQALDVARSTSPHNLTQTLKPAQRALMTARMLPVANLESEGTAFANSIGQPAYSRIAREQFFTKLRDSVPKEQLDGSQGAVIDVVQSMFDYAVDDKQVPDAARPLLWRLQLPSVVLSLLDARYLGDQPNSIRRLVENLSAIVMAFPDDVFKGSELFTRLETAVRAVEVVAHTLQTRAGVLADMIEKQFNESAKGVAVIAQRVKAQRHSLESMPERRNRRDYRRRPSREAEAAITDKLNSLLSQKLAGKEVPESVRQFLGTVWMRRLRTTALRDGQESQEFLVSLQVVDDLLWSLSDKNKRAERKQLAVQIPPLIKQLTQGVRSVGVDERELDSFFDELFLIHLRRMQREHLILVAPTVVSEEAPISETPAISENPKATVIERANALNQALGQSANSYAIPSIVPASSSVAQPESSSFVPPANQLKKLPANPSSGSPIDHTLDDSDWPVLGTDLVLPDPPVRKIETNASVAKFPSTPVIPSLHDLVPSQFKRDSKNRESFEKQTRTAKATRVGNSSQRPFAQQPNVFNTLPGPVKIQGMDQLAAAASINLLTIPGLDKKRRARDEATASARFDEAKKPLINLDGLPKLPSLTMPGKVKPATNERAISVPTQPPADALQVPSVPALTEWDASASERKLLELLDTVDVSEGHVDYVRRDLGPDEALDHLQIGTWIELIAGPDGSRFGKVAWINDRRTVVLIVREGDRKAMSLRSGELLTRFSERRAFLLKPAVGTPRRDQH